DIEISSFHAVKEEKIVDDDLTNEKLTELTHTIVFVTSKASPYSKSRGLGNVYGSLHTALVAREHRVMVIYPRYMGPFDEKFAGTSNLDCRNK
ncbi:soluble starch synthase 1, chloroplastic/amyloplastic, partial [Tanacetum coccineum]